MSWYLNLLGLLLILIELHLLEWQQRELEYLDAYRKVPRPHVFERNPVRMSEFCLGDDGSYGDMWISDDFVTDVFLEFDRRTRGGESAEYMKTLSGE